MRMERIIIKLHSVFIGHGFVQHASAEWSVGHKLRYHMYLIPRKKMTTTKVKTKVLHGNALESRPSLSNRTKQPNPEQSHLCAAHIHVIPALFSVYALYTSDVDLFCIVPLCALLTLTSSVCSTIASPSWRAARTYKVPNKRDVVKHHFPILLNLWPPKLGIWVS